MILRREVMGSCGLDWCTWTWSRGIMEVWTRCRLVSTWTRGQAGGVRHTWAAGGGADARLRRVSRGAGGRKWQVWVTPWQAQSNPDRCLRILCVCHSLQCIGGFPELSYWPLHWPVRNTASDRQYRWKSCPLLRIENMKTILMPMADGSPK